MVAILVVLLFVFLAAYFGIDQYAAAMQASDLRLRYVGISLLSPEFQAFLGAGIMFLMFAIILFSILPRIADTLRILIKPLILIIPLAAFLTSVYRTFTPIILSLLPADVAVAMGGDPNFNIAQAVEDGSLTEAILLTLLTGVLFLLASRAVDTENAEVRALRAELAKYKRAMK